MWFFEVIFAYLLVKSVLSSCCSIFLTTSSDSLTYYNSSLVINWGPDCEKPPDSFKLFGYNPYVVKTRPLTSLHPEEPRLMKSGRVETKIKLKVSPLPYNWDPHVPHDDLSIEGDHKKCLDFYLQSYNETNLATNFDCLKIQPQWMTELAEVWKMPLKELFIPGTHCSGCYMTRENGKRKELADHGFLQSFDIWHQLVFGIRYLDFSVGLAKGFKRRSHAEMFWIQNGEHLISPLVPILKEIVKFVERSKEIVILSFRRFSSTFDSNYKHYEAFKELLVDELGHYAVINPQDGRESFDLTIEEMKKVSKYLLITYNHHNLSVLPGMIRICLQLQCLVGYTLTYTLDGKKVEILRKFSENFYFFTFITLREKPSEKPNY